MKENYWVDISFSKLFNNMTKKEVEKICNEIFNVIWRSGGEYIKIKYEKQ